MTGKVADASLADAGRISFEWAKSRMPVIDKIASGKKKPLDGVRLGICLHVTKETSVLVMAAKKLGARISLCSANPLSVQNDIAAFLYGQDVDVYAWQGQTIPEYRRCIRDVLGSRPSIIVDDGGDLHLAAHKIAAGGIIGGTEETTSGVKRLMALEKSGRLAYPVIAVNNAKTKHLFDNRYGTGQSTIDGILRSTGILLAGLRVVVCGYGWVGKGVSARARGMGAVVTVTEVDSVRALEAKMDGFEVKRLSDAAVSADLFITCTGQTGVIRKEHIASMRDGAILANAGHFDVEIDVSYLYSNGHVLVRPNLERFEIDGKKVYLIAKGRVANLVCAEGNPPEVMALSFANQLLCILQIAENPVMPVKIHGVSQSIDQSVAEYALDQLGIEIDSLTEKQKKYQQ